MEKTFNATIQGEHVLIKYTKSQQDEERVVFRGETSLAGLPTFLFFVKDGRAGFLKAADVDLLTAVIQAINTYESQSI